MNKNRIARNIALSLTAQIVSFMVSFLLNLIVPKIIDEYSYANWQMYVLYVSYVGVLHFGLLDGIVLRYSQYDYDNIDKEKIRSQFKLLLWLTSVIMLITLCCSMRFDDITDRLIFSFVALGMVIKNIYTYSSYTFQITNRIDKYVFLVIVDRLFYGTIVAVLLLLKVNAFVFYCAADLGSDVLGILLSARFNKGMYFGKSIPISEAIEEFKINVSSGIMLLLANWSAILLIGAAKIIIQWRWNKLTFGKVSFSFSIINLVLTTVSAVSIVLFPSIKRMKMEELPKLYKEIRNVVIPLLIIVMLAYFPGCKLLNVFLPKYSISLSYLGILLPIIIPSTVVSLLTNNYFKAYRKEKIMLIVNSVSVVIGVILFSLCAYILNNLNTLLIALVISNIIRSFMSEKYISKVIGISINKDFMIETLIMFAFIFSASFEHKYIGFAMYFISLLIYCLIEREKILKLFTICINRIKKTI